MEMMHMQSSPSRKKIALFSHSSYFGGAESAFVNLVKLVIDCGHEAYVFLPSKAGELPKVFEALNVPVNFFDRGSIYGNTSEALLRFSTKDLSPIEALLTHLQCELVISNSSVFLEGSMAAAKLGLPHIWSIHEMQQANPEQPEGGMADGGFASWFAALSDHLIFCSEKAKRFHQIPRTLQPSATVLPPFLETSKTKLIPRPAESGHDGIVHLMFIGAPTVRKNPIFAIEVLAALRARGRNVDLNFIGGRRDQTGLIENLLKRRKLKKYVNFLGKVEDPYQYFSGKAINFICSRSEPFGLTVPESLSRGIPVVAPNHDGPAETLDEKYWFDLDNLAQCVRLVERVIDQYDDASQDALDNYERVRERFSNDIQQQLVASAIADAANNYRVKTMPQELQPQWFASVISPVLLGMECLSASIAEITGESKEDVLAKVQAEQQSVGDAVNQDIQIFDVVPYQQTTQMDALYKFGKGFSIELAATCNDTARLKMASYILLRLCTERTQLGRAMRVLAVGDGIGADSIRLASAGFDVDYMDYEASVTSEVAAENFRKFNENALVGSGSLRFRTRGELELGVYDAVISLEVIEHVAAPQEFLDFLAAQLTDGGLLFMSECFSGITAYWKTHLLENERLSGLAPFLAAQSGLEYVGCNLNPICKPYVFRRSTQPAQRLLARLTREPLVMQLMTQEQSRLVSARVRNFDKLVYAFKRIVINVRGYLARRRLAVKLRYSSRLT
jgi:glycosyltransferase involved in cell wall biosynthesis/2-polyprenyl-3-methyl-5-hydroxy-6-metoxy-1,4-benzoquinol methylase